MMVLMTVQEDLYEAARSLAEGDARAAVTRLQHVLTAGGLSPATEADVRYQLGIALDACRDREGKAREWGRVLQLDSAAPRPPALLTADEFESVAAAALDELPQALLDELNGVGILIEDRPSAELVADGLNRRSASFGAPYADTIHLYSANLERVCPTRETLVRQIRVTVLHETAHFFGYTEGQLRSMGLA
jgi:predicted Zn-dependent protease with MMP-like domain